MKIVKGPDLILLVAENNLEIFHIDQAFSVGGYKGKLRVARRIDEVCCYLTGVGIYQQRRLHPLPQLIILELLVPEVLEIIKWTRENYKTWVPMIGIGDPRCDTLVQSAFDLGLNAYMPKAEGYDTLADLALNTEFITQPLLSKLPQGAPRRSPAGRKVESSI